MMNTIRQWFVLCAWSLTDSINRLASRIEGYTARREAERAGEPRKPPSRPARVATYAVVYPPEASGLRAQCPAIYRGGEATISGPAAVPARVDRRRRNAFDVSV